MPVPSVLRNANVAQTNVWATCRNVLACALIVQASADHVNRVAVVARDARVTSVASVRTPVKHAPTSAKNPRANIARVAPRRVGNAQKNAARWQWPRSGKFNRHKRIRSPVPKTKKGNYMNTNTWIWIALIAFLVFCCGPMLFMGRRRSKDSDRKNVSDETKNKASSVKQPEPKDSPD